jgi:hypothetical protein
MDQVVEVAVAREAVVEPPRPRKRSEDSTEPRTDDTSDKE